jgi:hypothetical protein
MSAANVPIAAGATAAKTESAAVMRARQILAEDRPPTKAENAAFEDDLRQAGRDTVDFQTLLAIYRTIDHRADQAMRKQIAQRQVEAQSAIDNQLALRPARWKAMSHARRVLLLAQDRVPSHEATELVKVLLSLIEADTAAIPVPDTFEPSKW